MKFARSMTKSLKRLGTPTLIAIAVLLCMSVYFLTCRCNNMIEGLENKDEDVDDDKDKSDVDEKTTTVTKIMSKLDTDVLKYLGTLTDKQRDSLIEELNNKDEDDLDNYSKMSVEEVKKMVDKLDDTK